MQVGEDVLARSLARVAADLRSGELAAIVGANIAEAAAQLRDEGAPLHIIAVDWSTERGPERRISVALDGCADLAASLWPDWRPAQLSGPGLPASWRRGAAQQILSGKRPRFPRLAPPVELACLAAALPEFVLLAEADARAEAPAGEAIAVAEWFAQHGRRVLLAIAETPPRRAPWDRLRKMVFAPLPAVAKPVQIVSPLPDFRGSRIERRLRKALEETSDLAGLFEHEAVLDLGPLHKAPRVDLAWRKGQVVVELDGQEHEREPTYAADRHRDYELMISGYLVLRLTNDEVELDLARSLEKVRRVVNLRRPHS